MYLVATGLLAVPAAAATLPSGFQESIAFSGLTQPTVVKFAADGRVFVGEKSGLVKVFDNLTDTTPTVFADLRTNVHNYFDRGLLGLALHPDFPNTPYVYVLYTYDAEIGGTAPRWGAVGGTSDTCPNPPGTADGCVASGRLSRLRALGNQMTGSEEVLVSNWCQQFQSHSMGSVVFGPDGALYASAGDASNYNFPDYGQFGYPQKNICRDPPVGLGGTQDPATSQGGSLRSQNLGLAGYGVATYDGKILRIDAATGAALPDNPLAGSSVAGADRIIARGFRNPFRFTIRPGTNELWIGDVGLVDYEEIDRLENPTGPVPDYGWPCYEGLPQQPVWSTVGAGVCEALYATPGAAVGPYFQYHRDEKVVATDHCQMAESSITGVAFYGGGSYPANYDGALFFADYSRNCIWTMFPGLDGLPDPSTRDVFVDGASGPVNLEIGPGGDLFYVDFNGGTIRRIRSFSQNQPPIPALTADRTSGPVPLTVRFDGSGSRDPDGNLPLQYSWDLNGDGTFGDATGATASRTYTAAGTVTVQLRVTDALGASATTAVVISPGNSAPTARIVTPTSSPPPWKVGDVITFSGSATDPEQGTLPASALSWSLVLFHCPGGSCHTHPIQEFAGVASGSFTTPDHEYPSYLELTLTATDAGGLTDTKSIRLDPASVTLSFDARPSGLSLTVGTSAGPTPFTRTVIVNSSVFAGAQSPQSFGGTSYVFSSWSDGGAQTHGITAPASPATYVATFAASASTTTTSRPSSTTATSSTTSSSAPGPTATTSSTTRVSTTTSPTGTTLQLVVQPDPAAGVDTFLTAPGHPTRNWGTLTSLWVGYDATNNQRALLRFSLAAVPAGSTVLSCSLDVVADVVQSPAAGHVHRVTQPAWTETGATWNTYDGTTAWATPGGDVDATSALAFTPPAASGAYRFPSLASLCQDAITNRGGALHLLVRQDVETPSTTVRQWSFFSSDYTLDPTRRPKLTVTYRPNGGTTTTTPTTVPPTSSSTTTSSPPAPTSSTTSTTRSSTTTSPTATTLQLVVQPDPAAGVDTFLTAPGHPTRNWGTLASLWVGYDATNNQRALLRFSLAAVPAGSTVLSCSLDVVADVVQSPASGHVSRVTQPAWTEIGATWNTYNGTTPWVTPGGDVDATSALAFTPPAASGAYRFPSLASLCQDAIASRGGALHLLVRQDLETPSTTARQWSFFSSDYTLDPTRRPKLTVTYRPSGGTTTTTPTTVPPTTSSTTSTTRSSTTTSPTATTLQLVVQPDPAAGVDTFLTAPGHPTRNWGTLASLWVGYDATNDQRALLRFSLAAVPAGSTVLSCSLDVVADVVQSPAAGHVHRVTQPAWTETGATWDTYDGTTPWATPGGDVDAISAVAFSPPAASGTYRFPSLSTLCQDAIANRAGTLHLLVRQDIETPSTTVRQWSFFSSDYGVDPTRRPKLTVTYR